MNVVASGGTIGFAVRASIAGNEIVFSLVFTSSKNIKKNILHLEVYF